MDPQKRPTPWTGLRSKYLAALGDDAQVRIFDRTTRMAYVLHRWAAKYPLIRRVRVWPLCLSVAAAAPASDVEALTSAARVSLWVFTLDDVFDEERVPQRELLRRAQLYRSVARGDDLPPGDSLGRALVDVRNDLARYPLFGRLGGEWAASLAATIDGMVREDEWRRAHRSSLHADLPSYAEYVANGLYSIGGPPHIWGALITTGDPSTPDHLDHLRAMERQASICIRLANDLQSHRKELAEQKINGLVLISRALEAAGAAPAEAYRLAEEKVRGDITTGLAALGDLQRHAQTATGEPEAAIANIARFVCDFYTSHDYHTFNSSDRASLALPSGLAAGC